MQSVSSPVRGFLVPLSAPCPTSCTRHRATNQALPESRSGTRNAARLESSSLYTGCGHKSFQKDVCPKPARVLRRDRCILVKAAAETAETSVATEGKTASVTVSLEKEAAFGFQYALVGGDPALGGWDPAQAAVLDWSEGHVWSKTLDLPADSAIEYKFILVNNAMEAVEWQPGKNRTIATSAGATSIRGQWEEAPPEEPSESAGAPKGTVTSEADVSEGPSADVSEEGLVAEADIAPAASLAIERAADAAAGVTDDVTSSKPPPEKAPESASASSESPDANPPGNLALAGVSVLVASALFAAVAFTPDSADLIQRGDIKGAISVALSRLNPGDKLTGVADSVGQRSSQLLSAVSGEGFGALSEGLGGLTKATGEGLGGLSKAASESLGGVSKVTGEGFGGLTKAAGESFGGLTKATSASLEGLSKATGEGLGGLSKAAGESSTERVGRGRR